MLSRLQCTFCLNQNNVNDYIKPCTRQSLKCMHGIMLCPGITLTLATPLSDDHGVTEGFLQECKQKSLDNDRFSLVD